MPINRLLIANRGEIAIRISHEAADLDIETVGIYSLDDEQSLHVSSCGRCVSLDDSAVSAYLNVERILNLALEHECDAIHPGYGFLSESSNFAKQVEDAGILFVGPTPDSFALFGDKSVARRVAQSQKIPIIDGTNGATSLAAAIEFFDILPPGASMMIKALGGGGGRGMRVVSDKSQLESTYERCKSEASAAFGIGDVYVEQLIDKAKHVEVQVHEWALDQCKVPQAWQLIRDAGKLPGEGIVIGHPDSGYRSHTDMDADRIHTGYQWDFIEHDVNPTHRRGLHGLDTASVIMSGEGGEMKGPALHSKIVPMRVTKDTSLPGFAISGVVLIPRLNYKRLRRSLVYSQDRNFDVISISLGSPLWSWRKKVHTRIRRLNRQGAIVVAAAGNRFRFLGATRTSVTYPGRWHETVGVAASTVARTTWKGSCRGNSVDISAPGDSVGRADYRSVDTNAAPFVNRSAGTSFSTALVAGIAALWKSYRATELAAVDQGRIYAIFKQLIRSTAQTDHQLSPRTGAGIIDAHALLNADIPEDVNEQAPSGGGPIRIEVRSMLKDMASHFESLNPIANRSLTGLNERELCELDTALELELWHAVVNGQFDRRSILLELSQSLSNKLSGGN